MKHPVLPRLRTDVSFQSYLMRRNNGATDVHVDTSYDVAEEIHNRKLTKFEVDEDKIYP